MKFANITLLVLSVALAAIVVVLVSGPVLDLREYHDDLSQVTELEPYGGCKEAARYPNTPGWKWCADRGYLD